tara:strand:+ start:248 stop:598 length:351 start_codon:yes stop_codon:yes gene_type:complete
MATFTKTLLSGSTNGKSIDVTGTSTGASVTVHTAVSGTSDLDECWLYVQNIGAADAQLTIEWGETDEDGHIQLTVPGESGLIQVVPGLLLQNSLVIKAFASVANVLMVHGFVNRIS